MYYFEITVFPYDAETGEGMHETQQRWPDPLETPKDERLGLPKISHGSTTSDDGVLSIYSGLASGPVKLVVRAPGYEPEVITISEDVDEVMRVPMRRIPARGKEKQSPEN